jgi:hypothetical protein
LEVKWQAKATKQSKTKQSTNATSNTNSHDRAALRQQHPFDPPPHKIILQMLLVPVSLNIFFHLSLGCFGTLGMKEERKKKGGERNRKQ